MKTADPVVSERPLCVDLDGTLVRGDLLWESLLRLSRSRPLRLAAVPFWLLRGRAHLKQRIAALVQVDPTRLRYNPELLEHLRRERSAGRRLILVTASHAAPARCVADHVGLFDEVLATDGARNLKGRAKRAELVRRFGEGGFDYAGDSAADLAVWPSAHEALVVNPSQRVRRGLGSGASRIFDARRQSMLMLLLKAVRPQQWTKNLLLLLPILLAHGWLDTPALTRALIGVAAFCLGASAVYVFNDLLDVEADRNHPQKRNRPFASGELALPVGMLLAPALAVAAVAAGLLLPRGFLLALGVYFAMNLLYTLLLKEVALLDILVLAGLFTTRIMAGSAASGFAVSEWLLAFSMFIFLSLGAVKRYAELLRIRTEIGNDVKIERRGYFAGDLELIVTMGIASGYMAVLVLALYITSDTVTTLYGRPAVLWLAGPLLLFWISRIWLLAHRGRVREDPLDFAVKDPTTWIVGLLSVAIILLASGRIP